MTKGNEIVNMINEKYNLNLFTVDSAAMTEDIDNLLSSTRPSQLEEEVSRLRGLIKDMWHKDVFTGYDGLFDDETKSRFWNNFKSTHKL